MKDVRVVALTPQIILFPYVFHDLVFFSQVL